MQEHPPGQPANHGEGGVPEATLLEHKLTVTGGHEALSPTKPSDVLGTHMLAGMLELPEALHDVTVIRYLAVGGAASAPMIIIAAAKAIARRIVIGILG